jgi:hypothetical protein
MLLNLGLNQLAPSLPANLRKAPNIVAAPQSNIDVNAILGLAPSKYEGLQSVGDTGYFYGDNRMYEAYTPPPPTYNIYGMPMNRPSGGFMYGYQPAPKPSYESITVDGQEFRTVKPDIAGFSKMALSEDDYQKDSVYEYSPSMGYLYSKAPRPAPLPTPNVTSFLSTPTAMATPTGNYGAGRYLSGLLGSPITYGLPNDQTGSDS